MLLRWLRKFYQEKSKQWTWLQLTLTVLLLQCTAHHDATLLQVTDIAPKQIEIGDQVEITGQQLPSPSDVRRITVTLRGTIARAGQEICGQTQEVTLSDPPDGAVVTDPITGSTRPQTYAENSNRLIHLEGGQRIEFTVTPALLEQLMRCPATDSRAATPTQSVSHATLHLAGGTPDHPNGIIVRIEGLTSSIALRGVLHGPVIELLAPPAQRLAIESAAVDATGRALRFLGISLAVSHPTDGGLRIADVRAASPADRAGIIPNDVLTQLDGLTVLSLADLRLSEQARYARIGILRGEVAEDHVVSLSGFNRKTPNDFIFAVAFAVLLLTIVVVLKSNRPAWLRWIAAQLQRQHHQPNASEPARTGVLAYFRWALQSSVQWIVQGIWPDSVHSSHDRAVPVLVVAGMLVLLLGSVLGPWLLNLRLDVVSISAVVGLLQGIQWVIVRRYQLSPKTSVWNVREAFTSAIRAFLSVGVLVTGVLNAGTLQLHHFAVAQAGWPWRWLIFRSPTMPLLVVLYAWIALGNEANHFEEPTIRKQNATESQINRRRFWWTHWSLHWITMALRATLLAVMFLGSYRLPWISMSEQDGSVTWKMLGAFILSLKVLALLSVYAWLRWIYPRLAWAKIVHRVQYHWTGWAVVLMTVACIWGVWGARIPEFIQMAVSLATCTITALGLTVFFMSKTKRLVPAP